MEVGGIAFLKNNDLFMTNIKLLNNTAYDISGGILFKNVNKL